MFFSGVVPVKSLGGNELDWNLTFLDWYILSVSVVQPSTSAGVLYIAGVLGWHYTETTTTTITTTSGAVHFSHIHQHLSKATSQPASSGRRRRRNEKTTARIESIKNKANERRHVDANRIESNRTARSDRSSDRCITTRPAGCSACATKTSLRQLPGRSGTTSGNGLA